MSLCIGLDVETHSPVDLPRTGASVYARDPRTDCLLLSYKITGGNAPVSRWRKGEPPPDELMHYARTGAHFSGWNVIGFDRLIWRFILVERYGFEPIDDDRWLDSMHRAAAANLPRSLDGAASAVGMPFQKNLKDSNRIRRITNANRTPVPSAEDIAWLADRCDQDVLMEEGVLLRLPPWPQVEPWDRMPEIDRTINDRGVLVDLELIRGMAKAASTEGTRLSKAMAALTEGEVKATTNVEQLKNWLVTRGVVLPLVTDAEDEEDSDDEEPSETEKKSRWRLRKSDVADLLARDDIPEICRQALLIRAEAAKASVRKLNSMIAGADADGRIRGAHILMGAQQTARFCLAEGSRILVRDVDGVVFEKPIECVSRFDEVWDGDNWVSHDGVVFSGVKNVIEHDGVLATASHRVYVSDTESMPLADAKTQQRPLFEGNTCRPKHTEYTGLRLHQEKYTSVLPVLRSKTVGTRTFRAPSATISAATHRWRTLFANMGRALLKWKRLLTGWTKQEQSAPK